MKASRLLKLQQRTRRLLETEARAAALLEAERNLEHGLRELGVLRKRGRISEGEFSERRERLLAPVVERPVLS